MYIDNPTWKGTSSIAATISAKANAHLRGKKVISNYIPFFETEKDKKNDARNKFGSTF